MQARNTINNNYNGIFTTVFKAIRQFSSLPYRNNYSNTVYEQLFCDDTSLYKNELSIPFYPWDVLFSPDTEVEDVKNICRDTEIESRPRLIGYNLLSKAGIDVKEKELLGIVIEIHQQNGLDVLSVYSDGTARYITQAGTIIVWETPTPASIELNTVLFKAGKSLGQITAPWYSLRKIFPEKGKVRVSLLMSNGLHTKEGEFLRMRNDKSSSAVIEAGIKLMLLLTNYKNQQERNLLKNVF
jgi:hypothetical protein